MKIYYCDQIPQQVSQHRLAYLLLERGLALEYPGLWEGELRYGKDPYGKPFLEGHPEVQFNVSHCRTCVACAIGGEPVGIDVERRFPWKESLAQRICHPAEWEWLMDGPDRPARLNLLWSRKESYLKYIGTGIRGDLREVNVLELLGAPGCACMEFQTETFTLAACGRERVESLLHLRDLIPVE